MRELRDGSEVLLSVDFAPPAGYLMSAPGCGRILISQDGAELLCDPEPDQQDWVALLAAQALPLASTLRGLELLHASGVVIGGRARLFTGPPGAGKSSLAAALVRQGGELIGDDAVALALHEGSLTVHPGPGLINLRPGEVQRLAADERVALGPPSSSTGRSTYAAPAAAPAPLAELFLLERSNAQPTIERIDAIDPFDLLACTFNLSVRTPARLTRQLDVVGVLAARTGVYRLRVQPGVDAGGLAAILDEHFAFAAG
jgi:hypothetical protein